MLHEFFGGVGTFFRGFGLWARSPKLMFWGAVPAIVVGAVVLTVFVIIASHVDAIAAALTPFADDWDEPGRTLTRLAAGIALLVALVLLSVATFTALTLAVGDPFYERIWLAVEAERGGYDPAPELGLWASLRRGLVAGLRLLIPSTGVGLLLFVVGLIPGIGGALALVLGALLGGGLLARELLARPFDGRGMGAAEQRRTIGARRARATGFGAVTYLLFLLPLGAVVAMPAAVAGSALLARDLLAPAALPSPTPPAASDTGAA